MHRAERHDTVQLGLRTAVKVRLGLEQLEALDGGPVEAFAVAEARMSP
jgi:hypothetical protein